MVSVVGVTVYEALKDPVPLVAPQAAEPMRVALTVTVAVRVVVASLSVPALPVVCGPSTSTLHTAGTSIVHVKPVSRLNVADVVAALVTRSVMLPEHVTVAVRIPPRVHVPWKETVSEIASDAGLLVVPTPVPEAHWNETPP
jgi:hypothetical protein